MSAIFISHSNENTEAARLLLEQLRLGGFESAFLDVDSEKGILPGDGWETVLYRRIRACQVMIALISEQWLSSDWCKTEIRQAKALRKQIFPIRLDDSDMSILGEIEFVDLRGENLKDPNAYASLLASLERSKISKGVWDGKRAPYPGLSAFEEADAGIFFGREQEIEDCRDCLNALRDKGFPRWLVMIGASGCGKSSLVRAGIVPAIRADKHRRWIVIDPFRRGIDPFDTAALAMARAFRLMGSEKDAGVLRNILLHAEPTDLAALARDLRFATDNADASMLIVVDQLEELLAARLSLFASGSGEHGGSTEAASNEVNARFLAVLRKMTELEGAPFFILATLRADFLGVFQNNPDLRGLKSEAHIVTPPDLAELPRIIQEPAILAGMTFQEGLVDEIVRDTATQDALPLLAFTLRELYERSPRDGLIGNDEYHRLGGLQAAVANKADEVLRRLRIAPDSAEEAELRKAFLSLVQPGDERQVVRRRIQWTELPESVRPQLEEFVNARLMVSSESEGNDPVIEVAHEMLFRSWKKYSNWIAQTREFLAWRKRFDTDLERWKHSDRKDATLLHRPDIGEAESWLKKEGKLLTWSEREFIKSSIAAEQRRKLWVRLSVSATLLVLLTVSTAAVMQKHKADIVAVRVRNAAMISIGSQASDPIIQTAVLREVASPQPSEWIAIATLVAHTAKPIVISLAENSFETTSAEFSPDGNKIIRGGLDGRVRVRNLDGSGQYIELKGHTDQIITEVFSPDGRKVLTCSSDKTARVWNTDGTGKPIVLKGHAAAVRSAVFSSDGKKILTGSSDGTARVWNADGTGKPIVLKGHAAAVGSAVLFSSDGKKILTGSYDATARVWNADGTGKPVELEGTPMAFSADGKKVLTGSRDNTARIWNVDDVEKSVELKGHLDRVTSAAFSADGKKVLTGSDDNTARIWNVDDVEKSVELKGHLDRVTSVAFSPDGKKVLTGSDDNTVRIWNVDDVEKFVELKGHTTGIVSAAFSADGKKVLTISVGGAMRVWTVEGIGEPVKLKGHTGSIASVAFSSDGKKILTGSYDATARVWNADGTGKPIVLKGHAAAVSSVVFSADSRRILTGSDDETARVWNADGTGKPIVLKGCEKWVNSVVFSADGKKVLTRSTDETTRVWNADGTGKPVELKGTPMAFSADGKKVLTRSTDGTTRVWNADGTGKPVELKGTPMAFSADGKKILTGSSDGTARVWNADGTGKPVELKGMPMAFSADGKKVLTDSSDAIARVWNADGTGRPVELQRHTGFIRSAAFSRDSKKVLIGSYKGSTMRVSLWNTDGTGQPIELTDGVSSMAFSPDGKKVVTGSEDYIARIWSVDPLDIRTLLWRQTGFCLSPEQRTNLLGEDEIVARERYRRCGKTVQSCRAGFYTCKRVVAAAYDNDSY